MVAAPCNVSILNSNAEHNQITNIQLLGHSINVFPQKDHPSKQEFYIISPKFVVLQLYKVLVKLAVNSSRSCIGFLIWSELAIVLLLNFFL